MDKRDLSEKIAAINKNHKLALKVTPYELVNFYGYCRRSWRNVDEINAKLLEKNVEVGSDWYQDWFYAEVPLLYKGVYATTKVQSDSVKRVRIMAAANNKPTYVTTADSLMHAITLMQQNDFSQLPVLRIEDQALCGFISWKTIGLALWHGQEGELVENYMSSDVMTICYDMPLLKAIDIIADKEFVVVLDKEKKLSGIITASDITSEFFSITQAEAFLLLEQIEVQIRNILGHAGIRIAELPKFGNQDLQSVDDLTFGQYKKLFSDEEHWSKFGIRNDQQDFVDFLDEVRKIRNDVMHFDPDGLSLEQLQKLRNMARYLTEISHPNVE